MWILPNEVLASRIIWTPFEYWDIHVALKSSIGLFLVSN